MELIIELSLEVIHADILEVVALIICIVFLVALLILFVIIPLDIALLLWIHYILSGFWESFVLYVLKMDKWLAGLCEEDRSHCYELDHHWSYGLVFGFDDVRDFIVHLVVDQLEFR